MILRVGNRRAGARGGFTLLELLMVILVIGVLMALLLSAVMKMMGAAKSHRAQAAALALRTACETYHGRYHVWPCPEAHLEGGVDRTYAGGGAGGNNTIAAYLLGDDGPHAGEVASDPYIDLADYPTDEHGNLLSPWGRPYKVTVDINYDGAPTDGVSVTW